ncbi:MAG: photosystem II stability/assembly factor-like uncharacterized protein [Flavobacteriales bacterium]|jgi:photosystem II stability/assembly factor-like uncharacterized protein/cell division protein ZapA (FtsZ GTPase activity inhibitor)
MKNYSSLIITVLFSVSLLAQEANDYFAPVKYRNIGPFRGGRSVSASGVVNDPLTYYMGTTGGGLWKTTDAGTSWNNISDDFFKTGSVGAVAVSESNTNVIYCGMGEHAIRGVMSSYGDGVYKSTNAGKTWRHIGLEKTQQISRITIHPSNPDIVFVAAQGAYGGATTERGIYKSMDGGDTWKNVLYVNDVTGCSELSMDMNNPEVMYAAMWHHQRKPWKMISGGEGSGLYKSIDGGETWNRLEKGLPEKMGKMAIAVCRSNSDKVYALIESDTNEEEDKSGLYVSNNAGKTWTQKSGDNRLTQRAWYYTEVFPDPNNDEVLYVLSAPALRSTDGGSSWSRIRGTHGDYHDLWINPSNSKNLCIANDGGAAISFNTGSTWTSQDIMPTAQIYRLSVDNLFPYNIYGGQQDNSSIKIANMSLGRGSITEQDWTYAAGGESAFLAFDPDDPKLVFGGSYLGTIDMLDMESKASNQVMAAPIQYLGKEARDMKYLYNWNAPIIWSKHEEQTVYHCAQLVLKTTDLGVTWTEFSPDLTRNIEERQGKGGGPYTNEAVGAENYGTISYMIESPHEKGVFYTGSDDGFVQITRNNGESWQNITPKKMEQCLVNAIEISPTDKGTAYIATTRYKFNDYTPAIYKTTDYGESWVNISEGIPYGAHTRVVREDPMDKNILYAGTEFGIYVSHNGGDSWESFQLNMPVTPILDLQIHMGDLVIATSGRSIWVLDDLGLVSQYKKQAGDVHIYKPEDAVYGSWGSPLSGNANPEDDDPADDFDGTTTYRGVNPANGVVLYYHLPKLEKKDEITLTIRNNKNEVIRTFTSKKDKDFVKNDGGAPAEPRLTKKEGLNRFVWDTKHTTMTSVPKVYIEAGFRGHKAIPGEYSVELKVKEKLVKTEAVIVANPLHKTSKDDFMTYDKFMGEMEANVIDMQTKVNALKKVQDNLGKMMSEMKKKSPEMDTTSVLFMSGIALIKKLKSWDEEMVQRKSQAYDDVENFENKFTADYLFLINQTDSDLPRVNKSSIDRRTELDGMWALLKNQADVLINNDIPAYNKMLWEAGIGALMVE